jgi:hypothetical protein
MRDVQELCACCKENAHVIRAAVRFHLLSLFSLTYTLSVSVLNDYRSN